MSIHGVCTLMFYICFLSLTIINKVAAMIEVQPVGSSDTSLLNGRADLNLTLSTNATTFIQRLEFTPNCTVTIHWHDNTVTRGVGSRSDPSNLAFLRMALPEPLKNRTDNEFASIYDEMTSGALSKTGWLVTAANVIEMSCISPQLERQLTINDLEASQNCTPTALFLGTLGWMTEPQNYTFNKDNDHCWQEFLRAALPIHV